MGYSPWGRTGTQVQSEREAVNPRSARRRFMPGAGCQRETGLEACPGESPV